jgi:membrane protease YdiL (CAAX protease family)
MRALAHKYAILEPVGVFVLIMAYIWDLRYSHPWIWLAILGLLLASHWLHRERAESLGFRRRNLAECFEDFAPALAFTSLCFVGCGILLRTTRPIAFDQGLTAWIGYIPWGLLQQYVLNGYFMNRFDGLVSRRAAPMVSAALFSGAHTPNWFLMAVTLLAGYCCARVYRRYRNLYFLGLAHGTLGFLIFLVIPDSVSHHLTVGPGWFSR